MQWKLEVSDLSLAWCNFRWHIRSLILVSILAQIYGGDLDIITKLTASEFLVGSADVIAAHCQLLIRVSCACKVLYRSNELYELHKG